MMHNEKNTNIKIIERNYELLKDDNKHPDRYDEEYRNNIFFFQICR